MISSTTAAIRDDSAVTTLPRSGTTPLGACDVCAHPLADHDPIARRYCTATFGSAITRGCICR